MTRAIDLAIAALIVGIAALAWLTLVDGYLAWHALAIVPLTLFWGLMLSGFVAASPGMIVFPVTIVAVAFFSWLIARHVDRRALRVILATGLYGAVVMGFAVFLSLFGFTSNG
jgi:hypothetical protein